MKKIFLIVMLFLGLHARAQNLDNKDIIGKWKVVGAEMTNNDLPEEDYKKMELLKDSFIQATFEFKTNNNCSFDIAVEELRIKQAHWKYSQKTNSFIIQDKKYMNTDKWILMEIAAKKEEDKIQFLLTELPFVLDVEKVNE